MNLSTGLSHGMTATSIMGGAAQSAGAAVNGAATTGAITAQIAANAQEGLQIAKAQSEASLMDAIGAALKSGANEIKDAAKPS